MGAFQDLSSYRRNIKQFLLCSLHSDWHKIISKCKILFSWFLILRICDCDPPTLAHHLCEVWPSIFPFFSSSHLFFVCLFVESTTAFSFFYSVVLRLGILHSLLFLSVWNGKQWSWSCLPSPFPQIHPASGFSETSVSFYISKYSHFATCGTPVFAHFWSSDFPVVFTWKKNLAIRNLASLCLRYLLSTYSACIIQVIVSMTLQGASQVALMIKKKKKIQAPTQETWVQPLGWEDPLERKWQHAPVFLPGKFCWLKTLVGYSLWGCKESTCLSDRAHTDITLQ